MKRLICILLCCVTVLALCCCQVDTKVQSPVVENDMEDDVTVVPEADAEKDNPVEITEKNVKFNLYFPDKEALYLYVEQRIVKVSSDESMEQAVLCELFKGPTFESLSPSVEGDDLLISVSTDDDGVCTVDFKQDFVTLNTGGTSRESFAVGSIVNSLCELENVESVLITVEGQKNVEFGHIMLDSPMTAFTELVAK